MGTQKHEPEVVQGVLEVQFRLDNAGPVTYLYGVEPSDYVRIGGVMPLVEFDTINDAVDMFHSSFSNFGLPRALSRLDVIAIRIRGFSGVAGYIMIDPVVDFDLLRRTQDKFGEQIRYYGEDGSPLHIVPLITPWEMKTA